jgi:hypothetical protein
MNLAIEPYLDQQTHWPQIGQHILAQYDDQSIIVYQAYCPAIGNFAAQNGYFGEGFSYSRMSWIKPNFLWMMYRSGWGTKENQEVTLALRLRREFFDSLVAAAVPSSWDRERYATQEAWSDAVARSDVRLQWDPDHSPAGGKIERRAIQLGVRGDTLKRFGKEELLEVIDLSEFVEQQRQILATQGKDHLQMPKERVYLPNQTR